MLSPLDYALLLLGFLAELYVVVCSLYHREFLKYIPLNFYMLSEALVTGGLFFGKVAKGSGKALPITLTNPETVALSITSITVKGLNAPEFGEIDNCVGTLGAGNSCTITVTFTPAAVGRQYGKVKIFDAARRSPQIVPAQGWGIK